MKAKFTIALCIASLCLVPATPCKASDADDSIKIVADVLLVRPGCLIATALGTAVFVAVLPIAAISRSVHRTAHVLVVKPARATFTRQLGDLDTLQDY